LTKVFISLWVITAKVKGVPLVLQQYLCFSLCHYRQGQSRFPGLTTVFVFFYVPLLPRAKPFPCFDNSTCVSPCSITAKVKAVPLV
jgi:hypothetical protein